ncbi:diguanylate cyclase [Pseudomonas sp. DP-17]|uniref:sensor domain-containing diguanylate cyclase n=1 Tax=Pseudomonas sp. DP-17 TaxID=1580486 RepID=UPI001EFAB4A2|nr:diguanylate cyclase [Pseudomonas sp. DP-17]MCG8908658.1 diguanylate cyclase [Pseudomonas sp. DP-17]
MHRLQSSLATYLGLGGLLCVLLLASTWLSEELARSERQRVEERLTYQGRSLAHQLEANLHEQVQGLDLLAQLWTHHGRMPRAEWELDARFYVRSFPGYQSIQWADPDLRIRWLEPLQGNEAALNFRLSAQHPNYATAMAARESGTAHLSDSVELLQGGRGFVLYTPVYIRDIDNQLRFDGFMQGVFRVGPLMDNLLKQADNHLFSVSLLEHGRPIYVRDQPGSDAGKQLRVPLRLLDNRSFELELRPTATLVQSLSTPLPTVVFSGGMAISLLLVAALFLARENARRATALSASNQLLNQEAEQRQSVEANLRDSRERLQLALDLTDSSRDALFIFDLQQRELLHMNRATYNGLGYSAEEFRHLLRDDPERLIPGFHAWIQLVQQAHRLNLSMIFQREMLRRDGSLQPAEINTQLIHQGDHDYLIAVARDNSERLQLEAQLHKLSQQDGLTGLFNRRYFDRQFQSEWRRLRRADAPLAVLMLDVDHFKRFNDCLGHLAGDDALRRLASCLQESLQREGDVACRYGGEEFVIILTDTGMGGASHVAARIHQRVAEMGIAHPAGELGRLTVSIGLAIAMPGQDAAPDQLIAQADQALYAAKHKGRNQTCVWPLDRAEHTLS